MSKIFSAHMLLSSSHKRAFTQGVSPRAETVIVVDFGAQYAQLIARRVRELGVYSEIVSSSITAKEIEARSPVGLILSGGPASVHVPGAPRLDTAVYSLDVPLLGICYGAQLIAEDIGGSVGHNDKGEYGRTDLKLGDPQSVDACADLEYSQSAGVCAVDSQSAADPESAVDTQSAVDTETEGGVLLGGLDASQSVWMSHFDCITRLPDDVSVTAYTADSPVAAFEDVKRGVYGVQFHPEVAHTPCGFTVIRRFLEIVCNASLAWSTGSVVKDSIVSIRNRIAEGTAICGLSGGVDSAVAAALVHQAIGDRLTCVLVDTGLLRLGEADNVVETFRRHLNMCLVKIDASDRFFAALAGITDPETKRKVIGELFIRIFEEARSDIAQAAQAEAQYLVQGTLYPDVIESGTAHAATIKSHHNVGGLPEDMDFKLVEPLRHLFKDEVRAVGREIGLPDEIVDRHPFPGPGLAVRIVGEVTRAKADILRGADAIVCHELQKAGLMADVWQAFAVLLDVRAVGVMGDQRTYGYPVVVRAVSSTDAMTADWVRLPYDVLATISSRIVSEVSGVNRVVYDITSKPPGTIEWE